jgi:hypothetical protein
MKIPSKLKRILAQLGLLIIAALIAWQELHRPPTIPSDVYPYLTSLSPALVKQCINENRTSPTIVLEELLAIRSTLPEGEGLPLIDQLKGSVPFSDLDWGAIPQKIKRLFKGIGKFSENILITSPASIDFPLLEKRGLKIVSVRIVKGVNADMRGPTFLAKKELPLSVFVEGELNN